MPHPYTSIGERTETGYVRKRNEDSLRVHRDAGLVVVADGMGGHPGGDMASRVAVEVVERAVAEEATGLTEALRLAHRAIIDSGRKAGTPGMGTTCVAARLRSDWLECAWVGDSRIYRLHADGLERLSRDHSYVQSLVDAGALSPEAAERHPERNVLTQCLGGFGDDTPEIGHRRVPVVPGDRLLLCTDGLTGELHDARIESVLADEPKDQQAAWALVEAALAAGGRDNVTVIVATV